jgi:hypothetical protein
MVTPKRLSVDAQRAIQDMVELDMYLMVQSQQTPWPLLSRGNEKLHTGRKPSSNMVESSAALELVLSGFIEATSSRTFVVSRSGYEFYVREMKPHSA